MVITKCVECGIRKQDKQKFYKVNESYYVKEEPLKLDRDGVLCGLCYTRRFNHYKV